MASSEPPERREIIAAIANAAAALRKREPHSPAPYLMMRGLRWGELRASSQLSDGRLLEAPPTELRQHVKRLALDKKWNELLETAENAMSLPCSRAWLGSAAAGGGSLHRAGQRVRAYCGCHPVRTKNAFARHAALLDANLLDDTPAANAETRAWLKELMDAPAPTVAAPAAPKTAAPNRLRAVTTGCPRGWRRPRMLMCWLRKP